MTRECFVKPEQHAHPAPDSRLQQPLTAYLLRTLRARSQVSIELAWPVEEGCFVPELQAEDALALAEAYGQLAVVVGGQDGVPRLAWTGLAEAAGT